MLTKLAHTQCKNKHLALLTCRHQTGCYKRQLHHSIDQKLEFLKLEYIEKALIQFIFNCCNVFKQTHFIPPH